MRFASFACGQQNFSFREWLLSHEKCENKSFSKIAYGTIPEDQVFEGEKEGIQIQTHWYMCLSADIRYTYDISSTRTITLQPDGGGLRRPNQTLFIFCTWTIRHGNGACVSFFARGSVCYYSYSLCQSIDNTVLVSEVLRKPSSKWVLMISRNSWRERSQAEQTQRKIQGTQKSR